MLKYDINKRILHMDAKLQVIGWLADTYKKDMFMRTITLLAILLLTAALPAAQLEIAEYYGARSAALSLTYDDGFRHQGAEHVKMMKPYGFKGTFFIVVGQTKDNKPPKEWGNRMSWELLREMHKDGHEIANHSWSHAALKKGVPQDTLDKEVNYAFDVFKQKMGFAPYSFAFPGGSRHKEVPGLAEARHPCVRGHVLTYGGNRWTTDKANAWIDESIAQGKWNVAMIHGIKGGWSHFRNPADFDAHLKYAKSKEDLLWVAPMADVHKYLAQKKAATLKGKVKKSGASFECYVNGLDADTYNVPLTVTIKNAKVKKVTAKAGSKKLPTYLRNGLVCVDVPVTGKPLKVEVSFK